MMQSKQIKKDEFVRRHESENYSEAMVELTDYCNFKCMHCYNDDSHSQRSFEDIKKTIDILKKLGVTHLSLTGGEALVHPNFEKIYRYIIENSFKVTIFTNGSNITKYALLWKELPPCKFSISLYGIDDNMYNRFTQTKGMFQKVKDGMDMLTEMKIPFEIKTLVTKENIKSVLNGDYTLFSKKYGLTIRYGMELFETEAKNNIIQQLRLDVSEMCSFINLSINSAKRHRYADCINYDPVYNECKAGRTSLAVNSKGAFCICLRDCNNGILVDEIESIRNFLSNRKDELNRINVSRECAKCKANDICNGICSLEPSIPGSDICEFHHTMMKIEGVFEDV